MDIEPFILIYSPFIHTHIYHAFFHTHLGASIAGLVLVPFLYLFKKPLTWLLNLFGLKQPSSTLKLSISSLLGPNFHVLLDAFLYTEMNPFFPLLGNPFYGIFTPSQVYFFCIVCFMVAIPLYILHVIRLQRTSNGNSCTRSLKKEEIEAT